MSELTAKGTVKGSQSLSYDLMGRLSSSKECRDKVCSTTESAYDGLSRLSKLTYPDATGVISAKSETLSYGYDASGRLQSLAGTVPYINAIAYDPNGRILNIDYGNGISAQYAIDPARLWLNSMNVLGPRSQRPTLYSTTYSHDATGRISAIASTTDPALNEQFAYDPLNRVTQGIGKTPQQFAYDNIGNIRYNSAVGTYTYPLAPSCSPPALCFTRPHAVLQAGSNKYAYDENGNMISGGGRKIEWNVDNVPISVSTAGGMTLFDYDASNRLASRKSPGKNVTTFYFGPLVERTSDGNVTYYYFAGPLLVARRTYLAVSKQSTLSWYHQDHLASITMVSNDQGKVATRSDYGVFGPTLATQRETLDEYGFAGQLRNPSTSVTGSDVASIIHFNARYYDATLARFLSPDTIVPDLQNPQSLNRYSYVDNNPVSLLDPTGTRTRLVTAKAPRSEVPLGAGGRGSRDA